MVFPLSTLLATTGLRPRATAWETLERGVRGNGAVGADQSASRRIIMPSPPAPVQAR